MMLRRMVSGLSTAVLAAACAVDAPSGATGPIEGLALAHHAAAVPLRAAYRAPVGFTPVLPDICATQLADITHGGGQASHLGRFTGETFGCVDFEELRVTDGRFVFTAADGSQLEGSYELEASPLSPTLLAVAGPFTITGGSRRFDGASGAGQITGTGDLGAGQLVLHFDGHLNVPRR